MQFMVYFTRKDGEPSAPPSPEGMAAMHKLMEDAFRSSMVVATGQLGRTATRVRLAGGKVTVSDGPFIEGKELLPGFTVIRVDTKQQAIDWAAKLRACMGDGEMRLAQLSTPDFESPSGPVPNGRAAG